MKRAIFKGDDRSAPHPCPSCGGRLGRNVQTVCRECVLKAKYGAGFWDEKDEAILVETWRAGVPVSEIAKRLGRKLFGVKSYAADHRRRLGLEPRQKAPVIGPHRYHDPDWLRARYIDDRLTFEEIGKLCGVWQKTIHTAAVQFGIPTRSPGSRRYVGKSSVQLCIDRRARVAKLIGTHTDAEWDAIVAKQRSKCARCSKKAKLERDHVIPVTHGGSNYAFNIQGLCRRCNISKGNRIAAGTQATLFDRSVSA